MYRKALAAAAEARGWAVHWYHAKKVFDAASGALRIEDLDAHFLELGGPSDRLGQGLQARHGGGDRRGSSNVNGAARLRASHAKSVWEARLRFVLVLPLHARINKPAQAELRRATLQSFIQITSAASDLSFEKGRDFWLNTTERRSRRENLQRHWLSDYLSATCWLVCFSRPPDLGPWAGL